MRGNLVGTITFNSDDAKVPAYKSGKSAKGVEWARINPIIHAGKNNTIFSEVMGSKTDVIKTMDSENNKIEISWDDRYDQSVVGTVANYKKHFVTIGDIGNEFVADYDFVNYINKNRDLFKDKKFVVTANIQKNVYKGKISDRFVVQSIYEVDKDRKEQFKVTAEFFFNKDSIDTADWASEKKLIFNGYTSEYMSDVSCNKYVPLQIVFDCSKIDFDNEKHVNLVNFKLKQMGCELDGSKIKVNIKSKTYYKQMVVLSYQNGAEEVPFDESCLTDMQKEAIELGIKKLEDFRPAGSIYGERVVVYKLVDFAMTGKYEDGYVDTEITADEFEEDIYVIPEEESVDEVVAKAEAKAKTKDEPEDEDDEEDLFG